MDTWQTTEQRVSKVGLLSIFPELDSPSLTVWHARQSSDLTIGWNNSTGSNRNRKNETTNKQQLVWTKTPENEPTSGIDWLVWQNAMRRAGRNPTDVEVLDIINKIDDGSGYLDLKVTFRTLITATLDTRALEGQSLFHQEFLYIMAELNKDADLETGYKETFRWVESNGGSSCLKLWRGLKLWQKRVI